MDWLHGLHDRLFLGIGSAADRAGDLPILAWYGIPAHEATVERFEELRDAGFTLNFRSFPSADAVAKGLDAAGKAGTN